MPTANPAPETEPLYRIEDLKVLRRDSLLYAKSFPPGPERNQHRQIALSLRRLLRNQQRPDKHILRG